MDNSSPKIYTEFLPISRADMEARGWEQLDFVVVLCADRTNTVTSRRHF